MENVRFGIIGAGNMGSSHMERINRGDIKNACVTAVCDINPEKLKSAQETCGKAAKYFEDYKDLISSRLCDAVLIATPHYFHMPIANDAFAQGLNVLTEKPAGVYTKAVQETIEIAKKSGKLFGIMFNQRTNPAYQKAREMVKSGALGELKRFVWINTDWYRTQNYYNSGSWRATWKGEGGGVLINQGAHQLDLIQWIFGMPERVRAFGYEGKYHNIEVEDDITIYAEYKNGAVAQYITATGEYPGTNRLEISGDLGKIVIDGEDRLTHWSYSRHEREFCFDSTEDPPVEVKEYAYDGYGAQHNGILQNYTDALINGTPLLAPGEEGIYALQINNAAYLSCWTDDWVKIPVDADLYLKYLNKKIESSKCK